MATVKKSLGQYLLSYFKQIQIEATSGEFSDSLEVVLFEGRYMLNTANATYSFEDRYSSYKTALHTIATQIPQMKTALVLGLGLGSIPQMLQRNFNFTGHIDCVEIDGKIMQLAEKYYPSTPLFNQLTMHKNDALQWMELNTKQFDLIAVDLFIDKNVPLQFQSNAFMILLKKTLQPNGILLFSRMSENYRAEQSLIDNLNLVFPTGKAIDTGGNMIYYYKNSAV